MCRISPRLLLAVLLSLGACGHGDHHRDLDPGDADAEQDTAESDTAPQSPPADTEPQGDAAPAQPEQEDTRPEREVTAADDADGPSAARIALSFVGCAPDLSGHVIVTTDATSLTVSSTAGGQLTGAVQVTLDGLAGEQPLSTRHRVDTGAVVNIIVGSVGSTWTNLARDAAAVLSGAAPDPIGGTLWVDSHDRGAGTMDLRFEGVTLQNPGDGSVCTVDGRLEVFGPSF